MRYAKRVTSPLKGGVDAELGPKTLLLGNNGAGKTAILQALKLGTQGYVDDQEGKDGVSMTQVLARLFPPEVPLEAEVEMSDGAVFAWSATTRGGGYAKPQVTRPYDVRFPFHATKKLLSGDEKTIRAWLEQRSGSVASEDDLLAMLPPAQHGDAKAVLRRFPARSPVELASTLKKEAASLRREATKKEKTINTLIEGIPLPLSDAAAAKLEERKNLLWVEAQTQEGMSPAVHAEMRARIGEFAETLEAVQAQIEQLPAEGDDDEETFRIASLAHSLTKKHLEHLGGDVCYVCMRQDADVNGSYERWSTVLGEFGAAGSRKRLQDHYDRGLTELTTLAERWKGATVVDVAPLLAEHSEVSATLATHLSNARLWRQAEGLRKEVAGGRALADTCAALGRTWDVEGKQLLLRRKKAYEDSVTKWLPAGEIFVLDLEASRVGLAHVLFPNIIRTSLSGAELSRVLLAVLSAEEGADSTPSILEPEDRGWDPATLADVMASLTEAPDQVILMSTVPPTGMEYDKDTGALKGQPPAGWNVVHVM